MPDIIISNISLNNDWKFFVSTSNKQNSSFKQFIKPNFDDSSWKSVNTPHDWAIEQKFNINLEGATGKLNWHGIAFYRKKLFIHQNNKNSIIFLDFDGAMANAEIYVNGELAGGREYGYMPFRVNITKFLNFGEKNTLTVKLDTINWNSRWYPGAGLYRKIALLSKNPVHIKKWGQYITTPAITPDYAILNIKLDVSNYLTKNSQFNLKTEIFEYGINAKKGRKIIEYSSSCSINPNSEKKFELNIKLDNPKLWNIENPFRYLAVSQIISQNKIIDISKQPFGIRKIEFTTKGFFLNNQKTPLKGVCMHHDLGPLGTAFNSSAFTRQMEKLIEMGANAIRTAHNPPAPEVLEICDRLGILIEIDSFDCWRQSKKKLDYGEIFDKCHKKDLSDIIKMCRSHPSVIIWNLGNETLEIKKIEGIEIMHKLREIAHSLDPTRPVTMGSNAPQPAFSGMQLETDIFGFNYCLNAMMKFHNAQENKNIPFHGSETASAISSRGEYFFPVPEFDFSQTPARHITKVSDINSVNDHSLCSNFQVTSYDTVAPGWGCTPDFQFAMMEKIKNSCGEFVWTGFDYIGEPTPYNSDMTNLFNFTDHATIEKVKIKLEKKHKKPTPARSSYFGIFDLCGFPKDRYYLYKSHWRPNIPTAHILPHWNWSNRLGKQTPVFIYTSGDEAELFLNGKSLGRQKKEKYHYRLCWHNVNYEPGTLFVQTYKNGKQWCSDKMKTTDHPFCVKLEKEKNLTIQYKNPLIFIIAKILDKNNLTVPNADNNLNFSITGPGQIIAVDNGDPNSLKTFADTQKNAFNGYCLVIIKRLKNKINSMKTPIVLKAESPDINNTQIML